eukprot:TRINITY_DN49554_c0_g1_i1.p1 TRINITY_DN49554_c0_g1~~TRINITY_DN49554_c0_g1_i1.p1  ORF type:complete len:271 (+),score=31.30 TRINITY_DN49554_c0_g1_i1:55-867(+)
MTKYVRTLVTRTHVPIGGGFYVSWPCRVASYLKQQAREPALQRTCLKARVIAHTTPAVRDIGGASVCLRCENDEALQDGGYIIAIRAGGTDAFLPGIAGIPGRKGGCDRYGASRMNQAECMVMARPLIDDRACMQSKLDDEAKVTFLHEAVLREWLPVDSECDFVVLEKLTDFFVGFNAGTWLRIRINDIADAALARVEKDNNFCTYGATMDNTGSDEGRWSQLLDSTGLLLEPEGAVESPPEDASAMWMHWGGGGNTGASGQVLIPSEA